MKDGVESEPGERKLENRDGRLRGFVLASFVDFLNKLIRGSPTLSGSSNLCVTLARYRIPFATFGYVPGWFAGVWSATAIGPMWMAVGRRHWRPGLVVWASVNLMAVLVPVDGVVAGVGSARNGDRTNVIR